MLTLLVGVAEALVYKVPNESTLQSGIFADEVPIFFQAADRVTHSVGIFTLDKGFVRVLTIAFHVVIVGIHGATDVAISCVDGLLILCGSTAVVSFNPVVGSLKVGSVAGFVTQTPEDD